MPPDEIAAIEAQLEPPARLLFRHLRGLLDEQKSLVESLKTQLTERDAAHQAQQVERDALLKTLSEQLAIANEQVADLKRRLYGPRSERIPTVREEIRKEDAADALTIDGAPMPELEAITRKRSVSIMRSVVEVRRWSGSVWPREGSGGRDMAR